jgi:phage gpG-like protein
MNIEFKSNFGVKPFNLWWWQAAKEEWAPTLIEDNKPYWKNQTETNGRPWQPLSAKYRAWKERKFGSLPILRLSGKMQDSARIVTYLRNDKVDVETTKVGPYHQFGTSTIPSRPWMGVPDKSLSRLSEISWKYILK